MCGQQGGRLHSAQLALTEKVVSHLEISTHLATLILWPGGVCFNFMHRFELDPAMQFIDNAVHRFGSCDYSGADAHVEHE
jgi:hypothetical protein